MKVRYFEKKESIHSKKKAARNSLHVRSQKNLSIMNLNDEADFRASTPRFIKQMKSHDRNEFIQAVITTTESQIPNATTEGYSTKSRSRNPVVQPKQYDTRSRSQTINSQTKTLNYTT